MFRRFLAVSALTASVLLPVSALAGKTATVPEIQTTGISAFDPTFTQAKDIHAKVTGEATNIHTARDNATKLLGAATDAPFATALADLKGKAEGKIKVAMSGTMPKLSPDAALPDNVKQGVDAVNGLVDAGGHAVDTCVGLKKDAEQLVAAVKGFPGQLPSLVSNPLELPKKTKIIADNVTAVGHIPTEIDDLVKEVEGLYKDISGAFGG
jgi:hypothetical protein